MGREHAWRSISFARGLAPLLLLASEEARFAGPLHPPAAEGRQELEPQRRQANERRNALMNDMPVIYQHLPTSLLRKLLWT